MKRPGHRQELTPGPYAQYAESGGDVPSLWQVNGTRIYYNDGNVGIEDLLELLADWTG